MKTNLWPEYVLLAKKKATLQLLSLKSFTSFENARKLRKFAKIWDIYFLNKLLSDLYGWNLVEKYVNMHWIFGQKIKLLG